MRKVRILVCIPGSFLDDFFSPAARSELLSLGDVMVRTDLRAPHDNEAYNALIREFRPEILVTGWGTPRLKAETVLEVPELKYMCHVTGSIRANIEKAAMAVQRSDRPALLVSNWGPAGARPVAEGAMMMLLAGLRNAWPIQKAMHQEKGWPRHLAGKSLFGLKVGMHGLGIIAQEQVKLMQPWQPKISAYSPHVPDEVFTQLGVRRVTSLKALYAENEAVCIHASKTPENFHIVNAEILRAMPDGALLVNTARGAIIDEDALIAELKTGRISAALDVFEKEPLPPDSPLRGLDNCLLFPHVAGTTPSHSGGIADYALANLKRYLSGEPVKSVIPPERYDLMT